MSRRAGGPRARTGTGRCAAGGATTASGAGAGPAAHPPAGRGERGRACRVWAPSGAGREGMRPGECPSPPAWERLSPPSVIPTSGQAPRSSQRGTARSAPLAWKRETQGNGTPKCFPKRLGDNRLELKGTAAFSSSQTGILNPRRQTLLFGMYTLPLSNHKFLS